MSEEQIKEPTQTVEVSRYNKIIILEKEGDYKKKFFSRNQSALLFI